MAVRGLLLDFNGTLSDDEPLLCELFSELFAEQGKPLTPEEYYGQLQGMSDRDIVRTWLGRDDPEALAEYARRYIARAGDGSTISADARAALEAASETGVRIAVVSGAPHAAVEAALFGAGISGICTAVVAAEDVERGKPDPEPYLRGLALLGISAEEGVAVEDSEAGIVSAKAAGLYTVAVVGSVAEMQGAERFAAADERAGHVDAALVQRLVRR